MYLNTIVMLKYILTVVVYLAQFWRYEGLSPFHKCYNLTIIVFMSLIFFYMHEKECPRSYVGCCLFWSDSGSDEPATNQVHETN